MIDFKFVIPTTDTGANAKCQQFQAAAGTHLVALGYDAADLDEIIIATDGFNDTLVAAEAARTEYRTKVGVKDEARTNCLSVVRLWAQRIKTNPLATPEMLAEFGLEPSTPVAGPVTAPVELSAQPFANGTCVLRWGANGNVSGTNYVIETSVESGTWTWAGNTTKRTFTDEFASPGVQRAYRVRAQRAGETSASSNQAVIYFGEGDGDNEVQLAA